MKNLKIKMAAAILSVLLTPLANVHAIVLSRADQDLACELLLRSPTRPNPEAAVAIFDEIFRIPKLSKTDHSKYRPLRHSRTQSAIKTALQDLEGTALARRFSRLKIGQRPPILVQDEANLSDGLRSDMRTFVESELLKLPPPWIDFVSSCGRSVTIVDGPITNNPEISALANQIPFGWRVSYSHVPAVGGFRDGATINIRKLRKGVDHGSVNVVLHEFMHNLDSCVEDLMGEPLSETRYLVDLHSESHFLANDWFMKARRSEALAEFGAMFFHSRETREYLAYYYLGWHQFFLDLAFPQNIR